MCIAHWLEELSMYMCTSFDMFISVFVQSLRHLCRRVEGREDIESFRLKMILRFAHVHLFSFILHDV